mgnify:FL=1
MADLLWAAVARDFPIISGVVDVTDWVSINRDKELRVNNRTCYIADLVARVISFVLISAGSFVALIIITFVVV